MTERKEIKEIKEEIKLSDISIKDLLNKKFLDILESFKEHKIMPISIVLISKKGFLSVSHKSSKDYKNRIMAIESSDSTLLHDIKEQLKKM